MVRKAAAGANHYTSVAPASARLSRCHGDAIPDRAQALEQRSTGCVVSCSTWTA